MCNVTCRTELAFVGGLFLHEITEALVFTPVGPFVATTRVSIGRLVSAEICHWTAAGWSERVNVQYLDGVWRHVWRR